jgi:hypothetical protein
MKWEKYINLSDAELNNHLIILFEKNNGIKFPEQYYDLIVPYQGKNPEAYLIKVGKAEVEVGPVFYFSDEVSNSDYKTYQIEYMKASWGKYYPKLIPFIGAGGSGSCFALDFSMDNPSIVFINAEAEPGTKNSLIFVANSISDFLNMLEYE